MTVTPAVVRDTGQPIINPETHKIQENSLQHIVRVADAVTIEYPGITVLAYNAGEDFTGLGGSWITASQRHGRLWNEVSDRMYVILGGDGWFEIDGKRQKVSRGDVVFLPKKTVYDYGGTIEMFLVHSPVFEAGRDHLVPDVG